MAAKELIIDPATIDFNQVVADIEDIRRYNLQRYEMELLTAIVLEDAERTICVGYKDTTPQDFWVRGHMPGMPLMPGVVMLECAAQLCSYYAQKLDLLGTRMIGLGGFEEVRFRDPVTPGNRLILICQLIKARRGRMLVSRFQGAVHDNLVFEGTLKGVPIPMDALAKFQSNT